jgi:hypothetical protein
MSQEIDLEKVPDGKVLEVLGVGESEDDVPDDVLKKLTADQLKELADDVEMEE